MDFKRYKMTIELEFEVNLEKKDCYLIVMLSNLTVFVYRLVTDIP